MSGRDESILLKTLRGEPAPRAAVLCPGGMMSLVVTEILAAEGIRLVDAHGDARTMTRLALAMQRATGFDNVSMPFCMTVEAERWGARVDLGNDITQPKVLSRVEGTKVLSRVEGTKVLSRVEGPKVRGAVLDADGTGKLGHADFRAGRAGVLLDAIRRAKEQAPELPVIGNLVGPFSVLGMLADPLMVLRWTRRKPEVVERYLAEITDGLVEFGRLQLDAGADCICIAEPTATGEILGGELFARFASPALEKLIAALRESGVAGQSPATHSESDARRGSDPTRTSQPVILHICGDVSAIERELFRLSPDAMSFDSMVSLPKLAAKGPPWAVCGNVDAFLLERGPANLVLQRARSLASKGVRLLAPACGVVPTTPVAHLRALRDGAN